MPIHCQPLSPENFVLRMDCTNTGQDSKPEPRRKHTGTRPAPSQRVLDTLPKLLSPAALAIIVRRM